MATGSYSPIIILKVNELNVPINRQIGLMNIYIFRKRSLYLLSTKDSPKMKGHIQTENEGLEKDILCKQKPKECRESNIHIRSSKL